MNERWSVAALLVVIAAGCGPQATEQQKDPGDQRVEVPAPPAEGEGLQFVMPEEARQARSG